MSVMFLSNVVVKCCEEQFGYCFGDELLGLVLVMYSVVLVA